MEQGNTLPLIPLNIDPPEHVKYRRLLDLLFAPRHIDALEADIADRVHHFVDEFAGRGSCDFTAEFAELFPASVFLGDHVFADVPGAVGGLRPGGPVEGEVGLVRGGSPRRGARSASPR